MKKSHDPVQFKSCLESTLFKKILHYTCSICRSRVSDKCCGHYRHTCQILHTQRDRRSLGGQDHTSGSCKSVLYACRNGLLDLFRNLCQVDHIMQFAHGMYLQVMELNVATPLPVYMHLFQFMIYCCELTLSIRESATTMMTTARRDIGVQSLGTTVNTCKNICRDF